MFHSSASKNSHLTLVAEWVWFFTVNCLLCRMWLCMCCKIESLMWKMTGHSLLLDLMSAFALILSPNGMIVLLTGKTIFHLQNWVFRRHPFTMLSWKSVPCVVARYSVFLQSLAQRTSGFSLLNVLFHSCSLSTVLEH